MGKIARMRNADPVDIVKACLRVVGGEVTEDISEELDVLLNRLATLRTQSEHLQGVSFSPEVEALLVRAGKSPELFRPTV